MTDGSAAHRATNARKQAVSRVRELKNIVEALNKEQSVAWMAATKAQRAADRSRDAHAQCLTQLRYTTATLKKLDSALTDSRNVCSAKEVEAAALNGKLVAAEARDAASTGNPVTVAELVAVE
eukprot:6211813-Pleurochrysis_carterae.AAC.2